MTASVLIHVQHLLGTGHLKRAAALGSALAGAGFTVEIVSGGAPLPGLDTGGAVLFQLPPLRAVDATFRHLTGLDGKPIDDAGKARRRDLLLARFAARRPDIVITELFPFGRRLLEFELLPLIDAARNAQPRPLILASLRDILTSPADPAKSARAVERAVAWYDRVLVHGDRALIDLPSSYPAARELSHVVYTGYIASPPAAVPPLGDGDDEIVVSAGGSAVGARLLEVAGAAQRAGAGQGHKWRLLAGADLPAASRARLDAMTGPDLIVETARADFPNLLHRCHVSVSQAGYNTVMDILTARTRAVLVPISADGETEQAQRAGVLAARGWAQMLPEAALDATTLAEAIDRAGRQKRPDISALAIDGAAETVRVIRQLLAERRRTA